ncbi:TIGR01212 family radical SAM protein [Sediminispirochaeta bajacaliforniensis]|uniref:TIGR01212 family radical SAM protein n=1 Tax=Sediminispirochaeta bajacaliforniensis TaxID=148 RepID=UPI001FE1C37A|nr:TIGR01212 family radical SAM protein [Sediminispirochaeta bajacaliforniensis]
MMIRRLRKFPENPMKATLRGGGRLVNCRRSCDNESVTKRFYRYSSYLKDRYKEPVYRIGIDAGFGCPNRNPDGRGGCYYCDEAGSRAAYQEANGPHSFLRSSSGPDPDDPYWQTWMKRQIDEGGTFLSNRYGVHSFILYVQAFSGTWAPVPRLKHIYDYLLSLASFRELIVGTRPDCVDEEVVKLLSSYASSLDMDVWLELGLQSYHDQTLRHIGRGHDTSAFERAYETARAGGLKCSVHLIFGLPGEDDAMMEESVCRLARLRPDGVKIHNLHIAEGTRFAQWWREGRLQVPDTTHHLRLVADALELLPETTVVQRVTCDTPKARLLAPVDFASKAHFYRLLDEELEKRNSYQGRRFAECERNAPD